MPKTKSVKQVIGAVESEGNPRCEEGFMCVLPDCPKVDKYVCRPRKFIEHIQSYHKTEMRWWCNVCSKFFFKHTCWSKHCHYWHGQVEYVPETYCVKLFDVQVDRCEAPYNVKIEKKLKRKVETDQSDQPMKKKRRVVKAAKPSSLASDDTEKTIKST